MHSLSRSFLVLTLAALTKSSIYNEDGYHYRACTVLDLGTVSQQQIIVLPKIHFDTKDLKIGNVDNCASTGKVLVGTRVVVCALGGTTYVAPRLQAMGEHPLSLVSMHCRSWLGFSLRCPKGIDMFSYQYCDSPGGPEIFHMHGMKQPQRQS